MLGLVSETWKNLKDGRALNPLPLRRCVLDVLDAGLGAPAFWGGFPSEAAPHAVHATEVAVLSLAVAKGAGFSSSFLQDLGIAALLHDTGYLSHTVGDGQAAFARHTLEGARMILRQRGFHEAKVRRLRAVLEHHRDFATPNARPTPGGAILRMAEDYANVGRLFGARVLRADALGAMRKAVGTLYHPVLMQVMVNVLGRHPPGTLLELDDGRYARVCAPARAPELWDKPLARPIDPRTRELGPEVLDLARARASGARCPAKRAIIASCRSGTGPNDPGRRSKRGSSGRGPARPGARKRCASRPAGANRRERDPGPRAGS